MSVMCNRTAPLPLIVGLIVAVVVGPKLCDGSSLEVWDQLVVGNRTTSWNHDDSTAAAAPPSEAGIRVSNYGIKCVQSASCDFFDNVLLIVKLNPVRLLWLDALLNFYGTGFKNIAFFSALQKGDTSRQKFLRVGSRRVLVRLLDDNYGFCDHQTIAEAARLWPRFEGYLYLSDDVLMTFWNFVLFDKSQLWKQKPSLNPKSDKIDQGTLDAIKELNSVYRLKLSTASNLFAPTSGCYYVPNDAELLRHFTAVSDILMKHRSYNEWGTPLLLDVAMTLLRTTKPEPTSPAEDGQEQEGVAARRLLTKANKKDVTVMVLRGKLVWGWKRVLVRKMMLRAYSWYHPVRATGELFTRLIILLHKTQLGPKVQIPSSLFTSECLSCASYPVAQRQMKGLLHSCYRLTDQSQCISNDTKAAWPTFGDSALIGGRVVVPESRSKIQNPLELRHEGFWGKDITLYVFQKHYAFMNQTIHMGRLISRFPSCCLEEGGS